MTIDHFRPKSLFPHLLVAYANLYYCCCECNNYKLNRWPTDEELQAGFRFVDVCDDEWEDHIEVIADVMQPKSPCGKYTVEMLRLDRRLMTQRTRDLRARENRFRTDIARIAALHEEATAKGDAPSATILEDLRRSLEEQLQEIISPVPLEG